MLFYALIIFVSTLNDLLLRHIAVGAAAVAVVGVNLHSVGKNA